MKALLPIIVIWWIWFLGFLCIRTASGDVVLYKVPTGEVVEVFREPIPSQPGYDQVTVSNADLIVWPSPPGCTKGDRKWTLVDPSVDPPAFTVNPALKFFHCQIVGNAADVDQEATKEIAKLGGLATTSDQLDQVRQALWAMHILTRKCPENCALSSNPVTCASSSCDTERKIAQTLESALLNLNGQITAIQKEAEDFKVTEGIK